MFHIDFMNFKPVLAIDHGPRTTTDEFCDHIASLVLRTDWLITMKIVTNYMPREDMGTLP